MSIILLMENDHVIRQHLAGIHMNRGHIHIGDHSTLGATGVQATASAADPHLHGTILLNEGTIRTTSVRSCVVR